jgi:hypothetical protein
MKLNASKVSISFFTIPILILLLVSFSIFYSFLISDYYWIYYDPNRPSYINDSSSYSYSAFFLFFVGWLCLSLSTMYSFNFYLLFLLLSFILILVGTILQFIAFSYLPYSQKETSIYIYTVSSASFGLASLLMYVIYIALILLYYTR